MHLIELGQHIEVIAAIATLRVQHISHLQQLEVVLVLFRHLGCLHVEPWRTLALLPLRLETKRTVCTYRTGVSVYGRSIGELDIE